MIRLNRFELVWLKFPSQAADNMFNVFLLFCSFKFRIVESMQWIINLPSVTQLSENSVCLVLMVCFLICTFLSISEQYTMWDTVCAWILSDWQEQLRGSETVSYTSICHYMSCSQTLTYFSHISPSNFPLKANIYLIVAPRHGHRAQWSALLFKVH